MFWLTDCWIFYRINRAERKRQNATVFNVRCIRAYIVQNIKVTEGKQSKYANGWYKNATIEQIHERYACKKKNNSAQINQESNTHTCTPKKCGRHFSVCQRIIREFWVFGDDVYEVNGSNWKLCFGSPTTGSSAVIPICAEFTLWCIRNIYEFYQTWPLL